MRLPYVTNPPISTSESDNAIVERVKKRRGERGLTSLDLALLRSPPIADGWNSFLGAIRTQTSLSASVRETAICRVAVLNRAWYEWEHHAPLLPKDDISDSGVKYIFTAEPFTHASKILSSSGLDEKHLAVLQFMDYATLKVEVPDDVFQKLRGHYGDREVTEIVATVAAYNCVSRFLVALDIGERNGQEGMRQIVRNTSKDALADADPAPRSVP